MNRFDSNEAVTFDVELSVRLVCRTRILDQLNKMLSVETRYPSRTPIGAWKGEVFGLETEAAVEETRFVLTSNEDLVTQ